MSHGKEKGSLRFDFAWLLRLINITIWNGTTIGFCSEFLRRDFAQSGWDYWLAC